MVYYLGSKNTLPHYAKTKLLNGDPQKIEVSDTTPDAGFDVNTASSYPANQGRWIRPECVPTRIEWQENGPVPDVQTQHGMIVVPERFREIVEQFEPGVHQFLPVTYVDRDHSHMADRFYFVAGNRVDSVDREHTKMVLSKGHLWRPVKDLIRLNRFNEIPEGFDVEASPKIVFNNAQIGNRHVWSDKFLPLNGPKVSDPLAEALLAQEFTGIALSAAESV